jgi:hypothetical protein
MSIRQVINKVETRIDQSIRKATIELFSSVVKMTPVGNPDLWKINKEAADYNKAVAEENYRLRQDKSNLTKNGRLKRGKKVNDSMEIIKPDGYVGGRARANWQCTIGDRAIGEINDTDKSGNKTIGQIKSVVPKKAGQIVWLTNNVDYIRRLEYDKWSTQAPAGMVRVSLRRFSGMLTSGLESSLGDLK